MVRPQFDRYTRSIILPPLYNMDYLTTLPTELLMSICGELCAHCSGQRDSLPDPCTDTHWMQARLANSYHASRRLCDIGQLFLYHFYSPNETALAGPGPTTFKIVDDPKLPFFLRRVSKNPGLAKKISSSSDTGRWPSGTILSALHRLQR